MMLFVYAMNTRKEGLKKNDGKYYKSVKLISEYIDKISRDFMQKYDTLSMMKKMVEQISDDLQCVECSYTGYTPTVCNC